MNQQEKIALADALLEKHISLGFGSQTKSEIDLLIFHHLQQSNQYKSYSNYKLAALLKVPESTVKRLRLNAALRYREINSKAILGHLVLRTINGEQPIDLRGGKLELAIEDPVEKRELENYLKGGGHSAEYTLNSEVLKIEPIRLLELMLDNLEGAEEPFARVVTDALNDQASSERIVGRDSNVKRQLARLRNVVMDANIIVEICKALAVAAAA